MSWARLDDRFWINPKVRSVWTDCPGAVGLHVMAITYCAQSETDGHVSDDWLTMTVAVKKDRDRYVDSLTTGGLWHRNGTGWNLHDYLDYNPSKAKLEAKRAAERARREGSA